MKKMRSQKGVTLVALVVTIIVLIILVGISINLILGDNGIITITKKAKENIELAKIEEETELNELYTQLENNEESSGETTYDAIAKLTEFKKAIASAIGDAGGIKPEFSAETSVFEDNIKGIVKEVTKNATAIADNISEGKTAWVNGELVTGTGADNKESYDNGSKNGTDEYITNFDVLARYAYTSDGTKYWYTGTKEYTRDTNKNEYVMIVDGGTLTIPETSQIIYDQNLGVRYNKYIQIRLVHLGQGDTITMGNAGVILGTAHNNS